MQAEIHPFIDSSRETSQPSQFPLAVHRGLIPAYHQFCPLTQPLLGESAAAFTNRSGQWFILGRSEGLYPAPKGDERAVEISSLGGNGAERAFAIGRKMYLLCRSQVQELCITMRSIIPPPLCFLLGHLCLDGT